MITVSITPKFTGKQRDAETGLRTEGDETRTERGLKGD